VRYDKQDSVGVRYAKNDKLRYTVRAKKTFLVTNDGLVNFKVKGTCDVDQHFKEVLNSCFLDFVKFNVEIFVLTPNKCNPDFCRGNPEEGLSFRGTYLIFRRTKISDSELAMKLFNRFHFFLLSIAISNLQLLLYK
jgi:hypothetical protein